MDAILSLISEGWFGTAVGLVGIALAIVFYVRSKGSARLAYQYDHAMLVGGRGAVFPEELEIRFAGSVVPRVTASRVVVWNCGDRTINGIDVVSDDQLRVELPEGARILSHSVVRQTREVNGWAIVSSDNRLGLSFDFVDPGDGISIEVLHTESGGDVEVTGTIRGIPAGVRDYGRAAWSAYTTRQRRFPWNRPRYVLGFAVVVGLSLMAVGLLAPLLAPEDLDVFHTESAEIRWSLVGVGALYAVLPGLFLWVSRRRYPVTLEPDQERGRGDGVQDAVVAT